MSRQGVREFVVRRRALLCTLVSLAGWGTWAMIRDAGHPYRDLSRGVYTDHFSHMNSARLFTAAGLDIYRRPLAESARRLTEDEKARLPEDIRPALGGKSEVFAVPGWPADKPFISSWSHLPRPHPPGDLVLTAPVAALYSYTDLSFTGANRLLILLFLIYAHLALYIFFQSGLSFDRWTPVGFLILFFVYFEVIHWALEGFYEAILIVPLILCGRYLHRRRPLEAILAFTVAANFHFRAFFFAPLLVYAVFMLMNEQQWRQWRWKQYALALLAAGLGLVSLGVFRILWPWLREMPQTNGLNITARQVNVPAVITLSVVTAVIIGFLLYARAWLDAVLAAWIGLFVMLLREAFPWDILTLLAWLALPVAAGTREGRVGVVRDVRLAGLLFFAVFAFHNTTLMAPSWLNRIFTA